MHPEPGTQLLLRGGKPAYSLRHYRLRIFVPDAAEQSVQVDQLEFRIGSAAGNHLQLADATVSRLHCSIQLDEQGFRLRDLGSRNGTFVDGYRAHDLYLRPGAEIRCGQTRLQFHPLADTSPIPCSDERAFGPLLGASAAMRQLYAQLQKVAPTEITVLVQGETGSGKELVAEAIHQASRRAAQPFVVFDCAAVPPQLVESELFGHEKGAFTGASTRRIGRLEEAQGGTLFLDELGELPLELQPRLLRALESRRIQRVGGNQTVPLDIRVVAATHHDLSASINDGSFREDLYFRLAVVRLEVPPLRQRTDDIPMLVEKFLARAMPHDLQAQEQALAMMGEAEWERLQRYHWPGNVRELRNLVERTVALSLNSSSLDFMTPARDAPRQLAGDSVPAPQSPVAHPRALNLDCPFAEQKAATVEEFEKRYLQAQLLRHHGNYSRAAAASGLDRMYFKRLLKKYQPV